MTRTKTSLPYSHPWWGRLQPVNPSEARRSSSAPSARHPRQPANSLRLCVESALSLALLAAPAFSQATDLAPVVSKSLSRTADLPGEFQPFLTVSLHARVAGYIEKVLVDRSEEG